MYAAQANLPEAVALLSTVGANLDSQNGVSETATVKEILGINYV